jgi:hypothetical protein
MGPPKKKKNLSNVGSLVDVHGEPITMAERIPKTKICSFHVGIDNFL